MARPDCSSQILLVVLICNVRQRRNTTDSIALRALALLAECGQLSHQARSTDWDGAGSRSKSVRFQLDILFMRLLQAGSSVDCSFGLRIQ